MRCSKAGAGSDPGLAAEPQLSALTSQVSLCERHSLEICQSMKLREKRKEPSERSEGLRLTLPLSYVPKF